MTDLRISDALALPLDFATDTTAILAKKGAGKTYTGSVVAEEFAAAGIHFVAIDPTGAWFGLRSNAAGDGPGLPVVIFGGEHADVTIHPDQGEAVADFVVKQRVSAVIDLSGFRKGEQLRFMLGFAERLYHINREALALIIDEADAYAPQRTFPEGARLLGAIEDLVRRGRRKGIGTILITQRPAVLNKNVLEQCDNLFVLQITGPNDRKAIAAWVEQHATPEELREVNATLSTLKKGEAWIWSPTSLGILERVQIRRRRTFDSGRTPKVGEVAVAPKVLADVDLDAVRKKFAVVVDEAKADDPKVLRARIAELNAEVAKFRNLETAAPEIPEAWIAELDQARTDRDEYRRQRDVVRDAADSLVSALRLISGSATAAIEGASMIADELAAPPPEALERRAEPPAATRARVVDTSERESTRSSRPEGSSEVGQVKAGARRMLQQLARCGGTLTKGNLGVLAGVNSKSGTFSSYLSTLRGAGYITDDTRTVTVTREGAAAIGARIEHKPPTTESIIAIYRPTLKAGAVRMFDLIVAAYPKAIAKADLGQRSGVSPGSGTFSSYLSTIRSRGLLEDVDTQHVRAADVLFPTGKPR